MQKFSDIIIGFLLGYAIYGLLKWHPSVSFGDIVSLGTAIIAFMVYRKWEIDKLIELRENLRIRRYLYIEKEKEKEPIYALDYLNELEFIGGMILRGEIGSNLAEAHFKTWYSIVEDEEWMKIIKKEQETDEKAYENLLKVAKQFKFKLYDEKDNKE